MAILYPSNGAPPSDSGIPHSKMLVLAPTTRISNGAVGGEGTAGKKITHKLYVLENILRLSKYNLQRLYSMRCHLISKNKTNYLLACVFSEMLPVTAGALKPTAFSASTLNVYSDFSLRLSTQYCRQYVSSVTIFVHFEDFALPLSTM